MLVSFNQQGGISFKTGSVYTCIKSLYTDFLNTHRHQTEYFWYKLKGLEETKMHTENAAETKEMNARYQTIIQSGKVDRITA